MIDTHAHLEDERFNEDREELINSLKTNGIDYVFNCGSSLKTSRESVEMANKYDNIYAIVGIHPLEADEFSEESLEEIKQMAINEDKVVAIGEIGLDNYYEDSPSPEKQREAFLAQLDLAEELNLPVVIHSRDAHQETFDILKARKEKNENFTCVLHCYSGSVELMREYMKLGFYISLGGVTTFKNARVPKEVAKEVELDRIMLETDCPYMAPEPHRGKRNEPKFVNDIAKNMAELRGISLEELEKATDENAERFFRVEL